MFIRTCREWYVLLNFFFLEPEAESRRNTGFDPGSLIVAANHHLHSLFCKTATVTPD